MHWFGNKPQLNLQQQQRLVNWQALPQIPLNVPVSEMRCVVVDVETTGLDLTQDKLISIGAVAVVNGKIALGDSFYIILQQQAASNKGNILLHGIGGVTQLEGEPPVDALLAFLEYLGKAPLVAFHAAFDETMIRRALREYLGLSFKHPWLDLAYVMPELHPELASRHRALDDWLTHFSIGNEARHNALADALATAQLGLMALHTALARQAADFRSLQDMEKAQRWLNASR